MYEVVDLAALDFDPFLWESLSDAPVSRIRLPHGTGDCWLVTRHKDVRFVTSDRRFSRDVLGRSVPKMTKHFIPLDRAVSFVDPPDHARVRSVVSSSFTQRSVDRLRLRAGRLMDELCLELEAAGPSADLVHHVISPFALAMIGEVIGIPADDRPRVRDWAQTVLTRASDEAQALRAEEAKQAARDYFLRLAARRRAEPRQDVMSTMVAAVSAGRIDEEELLALATLMGLNGWHAVCNNTANMMYVLLTQRHLRERLQRQPRLILSAVDELLRWIPHKHGVGQPRLATEDVEVGGVLIREGECVYVSYVAANWDEQVYRDPGRIDLDRNGPPHLAFGHGPHVCVGPLLARMEAEVVLSTLISRFPAMRLAVPPGEMNWQTDVLIRGPVDLPVTW
ncbi:cytochrome P450 [Streptomyces melanogenes]|uniref:Cytochrome P450 n=1 Tax=Streptomyces melanogenes TaxID=67326 RepID=A0ABZ1XBD2_9ACTN|nr:cytochrome P450 [Streptomyces melanogenes]